MKERNGKQARRVAQQRNGRMQPAGLAETRYAGDSIGDDGRRQARAAVIVFGLALLGIFTAYAVLAAGDILA